MIDKMFIREKESFFIPFPHIGAVLGIKYNVSDFQIRNYGTREIIDYERIFYN
jgi:hypothetical protein